MIKELHEEYHLKITVNLVRSAVNKSDPLTCVPASWLRDEHCLPKVKDMHDKHHFVIERSLCLARQVDPHITRREVETVVKDCKECCFIDPAPVQWEKSVLDVERNWSRLAVDVTHYNGNKYLTAVDSVLSRFAIWKRITSEDASVVFAAVEEIFTEREDHHKNFFWTTVQHFVLISWKKCV